MISTLYRGSVKNLLGPAKIGTKEAVVFEYSDAYSVFDWGRMPDSLPRKGEALAVLAAAIFERVEKPETWKEFSKSPQALALRKANRFGASFIEIGEILQNEGLRTHYLGAVPNDADGERIQPGTLRDLKNPFRRIAVQQVSVVKPHWTSVLGRVLPDYQPTRLASLPKLIPLEIVFRFGCPEGSSLMDRTSANPDYLTSLGFADLKASPEARWDFPVLELFTKLETSDRPVSLSEALAISGLSGPVLQETLFKTAWVAGLLKFWCAKAGLELADGKLEWGLTEEGQPFLIDAIGPDELRMTKNGVQISKEILRKFYKKTKWYQNLERAKIQARKQGSVEWKRFVPEPPPSLSPREKEIATQLYLALANDFTGQRWFEEAWSLDQVVESLKEV